MFALSDSFIAKDGASAVDAEAELITKVLRVYKQMPGYKGQMCLSSDTIADKKIVMTYWADHDHLVNAKTNCSSFNNSLTKLNHVQTETLVVMSDAWASSASAA